MKIMKNIVIKEIFGHIRRTCISRVRKGGFTNQWKCALHRGKEEGACQAHIG